MQTIRFILCFVLLLIMAATVPAAVTNARAARGAASTEPLAVAVSVPPQKYFLERIGGNDVEVTVLTGKGKDPHSYEPTAAQMTGISKTRLYFAIGVPFETQWLPKFRAINPSLETVSLPDSVKRLHGKPDLALRGGRSGNGHDDDHDHDHDHDRDHGHDHHHGLETDDPHLWLSPKAVLQMIPAMTAALSRARPGKAAEFAARAEAFKAEVLELDARIRELFEPVPAEKRLFMTFHQSWAYYADAYGLREVSVELEGRAPSPKDMALLLDFAAKNKIRVIVSDPMTNASAVRSVTQSLGGVAVTATPLEENWSGSMRDFSETLAKALAQ